MELLHARPHVALTGLVRGYTQRRAALSEEAIVAPLAARPDQFIEFYLADRFRVSPDGVASALSPEVVVVGPQSRRGIWLHLSGTLDVFTIRFQPTGFHRLFGVPMGEVADQGLHAADVIGHRISRLEDALRQAAGFAARVAAAEAWLAAQAGSAMAPTLFDRAAAALLRQGGRVRMDDLARRAAVSPRHLQRRFVDAIGVAPKLYARTVRLDAALAMRGRDPALRWTDIAYAAGFTDQAHLVREFRALAGDAPGAFMAEMSKLGPPAAR